MGFLLESVSMLWAWRFLLVRTFFARRWAEV
jgi:hypothetical protein